MKEFDWSQEPPTRCSFEWGGFCDPSFGDTDQAMQCPKENKDGRFSSVRNKNTPPTPGRETSVLEANRCTCI